jgi:hypothetical protein
VIDGPVDSMVAIDGDGSLLLESPGYAIFHFVLMYGNPFTLDTEGIVPAMAHECCEVLAHVQIEGRGVPPRWTAR